MNIRIHLGVITIYTLNIYTHSKPKCRDKYGFIYILSVLHV